MRKNIHVLKLFNNTTKAWEVSTWLTYCCYCIEYRAIESAGTKRYSGISLIWQRLMFGSYTVFTFIRMENQIRIRNHCSNSVLTIRCSSKVNPSNSRGRPQKRRSLEVPTTSKKPTQALSVTDVYFDQVAHWRSPTTNKNRCKLCSMTCRMQCSKCMIFLCLLADCNSFVDFHIKP